MDSALPEQPGPDELALRRRVSDQEREDAADRLRESAGEGRLSYVELEERLEQVYGAKTYGELVSVTADLPNGLADPARPADVSAVLADVTIRVPPDAIVDLDGRPIIGSVKEQGAWSTGVQSATAESRVFHIRAKAVLADVKVKRGPSVAKRLLGH